MQLIDLYNRYSADEIITAIDEMFPGTEQFHDTFREALAILKALTPVPSKKRITGSQYQ